MNVLTPSPSTAQHIWKVNFFKWLPYNTQFTNLSKDSHSEAINLISGIKKIYYSSFPCKGRTNKILRFFLKRNLPDRILIHVQIFFLDYFPLSSCSTSWSLPESHFCTVPNVSTAYTLHSDRISVMQTACRVTKMWHERCASSSEPSPCSRSEMRHCEGIITETNTD